MSATIDSSHADSSQADQFDAASLQAAVVAATRGDRGLQLVGEPSLRRTAFLERLVGSLRHEQFVVTRLRPGAEPADVASLLSDATADRARRQGACQILLVVDAAESLGDRTLALLDRVTALLDGGSRPRLVVAGSQAFSARLADRELHGLLSYLETRLEVPDATAVSLPAVMSSQRRGMQHNPKAPDGGRRVRVISGRRASLSLDRGMIVAAVGGACLMAVAMAVTLQSVYRRSPPVSTGVIAAATEPVHDFNTAAAPSVSAPSPTLSAPSPAELPPSAPVPPSPAPPSLMPALAVPVPETATAPPVPVPVQPAPGSVGSMALANPGASPGTDLPGWLSHGGPGLVLVARPGDTLQRLYRSVYNGLVPPPFSAVQDANPNPIHSGTVVVFPTPPDGWHKPSG